MARPKKTLNEPETEQQQPDQHQSGQIQVRPVHGPMHHLILDKPIVGVTLFEEIDNWLEVQIAAGKLEIV